MAFSPLRTVSTKTKPVWSATKRRRKRAHALVQADPSKAPTTVNDGSPGEQAGD